MAVSVKHAFVSPIADAGDPNEVGPNEWNDEHTILGLGTAAEADSTDFATAAQGAKADTALQSVIQGTGITVDNTDPLNPIINATGGGSGDMTAAVYDPQNIAADAFARANHTGTQTAATISNFNTAADARISAAVGVSVQGYDADLTTWAGLTPSANAQSLVTAADYSAMRTLLGLVIGTNVQAYDADLTTWAGLTPSANAQSLVTAANYAAMRALLDLEAGTDFYSISAANAAFQPIDADLTSWAGVTRASGFDTFVATPSSANLRALLSDEVGTGTAYFVGGALGTPASGTATNLTGLPLSSGVTGQLPMANGGTGANLTDPNADRVLFWDDSAGAMTWLTMGTNLTITGTTLDAASGGTAASQSDQETATSTTTFVSPGRQQFHPSAAKFWALASAAGVLTTSYNLTSVTDTGTGDITFTIATDFSSANWTHASSENWAAGSGVYTSSIATRAGTKAAGTLQMLGSTGSGTASDPASPWNVVGYGDQ